MTPARDPGEGRALCGQEHRGQDDRGGDRDRDAAGRPRNARPRDGLGRPLPRSAPEERPTAETTDRVPDDLDIGPDEAVALARSLLSEGRPFHAHEVFEAMWKSGPAAERELWQGLAQLAVGLTHARRGNATGAVTLLRRGASRLRGYAATAPDPRPYGVDLPFVIDQAENQATRLEREDHAEGHLPFPLAPDE